MRLDLDAADEAFMARAVALAQAQVDSGKGGPFGAVIVKDGCVVSEGANEVTSANDPTAHAEVVAIRRACTALGTFSLEGATIYTSCEPCRMCLAAIYWARTGRIVFANTRAEAAAIGFDDAAIYDEVAKPIDARVIPTEHRPHEAARAAFKAWAVNPEKVPY